MMFDVERAKRLQERLSKRVSLDGLDLGRVRYVAGLDVSYSGDLGVGVAVLLTYPQLDPVEYVVVKGRVRVPYMPGLLAFREAPLLIRAVELLSIRPDLLVVDGHGVTHPRRFGIASHIGLVTDTASVGAAKSLLYGRVVDSGSERLIVVDDLVGGLVVRHGKTEVYLSIGHRVSLDNLRILSKTLFKHHDLPEPTYLADRVAKEVRAAEARR
jgi:deoxyribonuclease V